MMLSQPPETKRLTGAPGPLADSALPLGAAGAHDTEVAPRVCAPSICARLLCAHALSQLAVVSGVEICADLDSPGATMTRRMGERCALLCDSVREFVLFVNGK